MRIFISWSGEVSSYVAESLKTWLIDFFDALSPDDVFLSSEDIAKGEAWFDALMEVLDESSMGVLCLTPDNRLAPWIMFEAGALAKHLYAKNARVIPLVIGLKRDALPSPLNELNAADTKRADMLRLVRAVNESLAVPLDNAKFERKFNKEWQALDTVLTDATNRTGKPDGAPPCAFDVFLSVPMAGWPADEYNAKWGEMKKVFDALLDCKLRVYWSAEKIDTIAKFQAADVSADKDLRAIDQSRHFMLVYPKKLPTSAIFEAGYAYALGKPARYFASAFADLPYLMKKLPRLGNAKPPIIHSEDEWADFDALAQLIRSNGRDWFAN